MSLPPLAIVGVGLRLPGGVSSLDALRDLLLEGRSGVREVPPERWDAAALYHPDFRKRGHIHTTRGGFLDGVEQFDAGFFGLAPTEALRMDPQQRLVLEVAHEALEDAGFTLADVAGTRTSTFVGVGNYDYGTIQTERARIGSTSNTGSAGSIVANRVAFMFDLRGPSVAVDTACSSALTALHLACQTLWDGSCDLALAGGVNLILRPESSIGFSKGGYLSPDGECRAFSDDCNGYVRGEGAALALVMPLDAALRANRRIHGVVRATASNQDGKTPGMTMPSQEAQEAMLRRAYALAGVAPEQVAYVEAHGTGTPVGDPIEATAIGRVLGAGRPADRPLWLGSVKTNLGHLETAAGMAGLLKLLLVLRDRVVYPNRLFRAPNPAIPFDALRLRVATSPVPLPDGAPLLGGVNSFGFGGTNAHAVLEGPPDARPPAQPVSEQAGPHLVLLSARGEPALRATAGDVARWLRASPAPLAQACAALARQKTAFPFRLALTGADRDALARGLEAYARGEPAPGLRSARLPDTEPAQPVVFVFGGQGPQWWAMGRELLATNAAFRARVEATERDLAALGWLRDEGSSLTRELLRDEATSRIGETRIAQPALFALQLGLMDVLQAHGVVPAAVVGHSIGELAAAVCAGALTAQEAARLVVWRSRCQADAEGKGVMAALGLSEEAARPLLAPGRLELAAINGPTAVTIAGEREAVAEVGERLARDGAFFQRLDVSVPFHCFLMDPVEARFRDAVGQVAAHPARLTFISSVDGQARAGESLDADYWWRNIREPVRFYPAVRALLARGLTRFVEVGPHPILRRGLSEALREAGLQGAIAPTLVRGEPEAEAVLASVGALFLGNVTCSPVASDAPVPVLDLPRYPFQRRPYWLETPAAALLRKGGRPHPVVGAPVLSSESRRRFVAPLEVDPDAETYLRDHHVQGLIVLPGAGQLEAAHSAGKLAWGTDDLFLEDVVLRLPVSLPPEGDPPEFRFEVVSDEGHFQVASRRPGEPHAWSVHTRGRLNALDPFPARAIDLAAIQARVTEAHDPARFYAGMAETGLVLGECFQGIRELRVRAESGEVLTRVEVPAALEHELGRYRFHPALLDAVFQGSSLGSFRQARHGLFLPHRVRRLRFHRPPDGRPLWCYARLERAGGGEVELEVFALDPDGNTVVELHGFVLKLVAGSALARESLARRPFYDLVWEPAATAGEPRALTGTRWVVLADERGLGDRLGRALEAAGARATLVRPGGESASSVVAREGAIDGLVHLWTLDEAAASPEGAITRGSAALCAWAHALASSSPRPDARPGVWAITAARSAPWSGALWGAARVLRNEEPRLVTTLVELDPEASTIDDLLALLAAPSPPAELRLTTSGPEQLRLRPADAVVRKRLDVTARAYRARMGSVGVLDSARLVEARRRAPGPREVEVEVEAASLNFKDVVVGMGLLDAQTWQGGMSGAELGMDLAGVITAVGAEVEGLAPGDRVLGMAAGSLASHVVVDALHVIPRPEGMDPRLGAALPTVFLTADVALDRLAGLAPGETVLVHAAAGGVGTAAVQVARARGARVIGTTSSEKKREHLAALGVTTVFSSRSPTFREGVLAATDGRGVDVVLNSLSGDALAQGIRCLAPFGRFVEIGKLDLAANRQVGLEPFARNLSYHALDVNRWVTTFAAEGNRRLRALTARVASGELRMPFEAFPIERLGEALRFLAQGRAIGKVVVTLPREGEVEVDAGERALFRRDGTYVVSGGCGGFGLEVADWIARQGGGALVLLGRRGLDPASAARVEGLVEATGVRVLAPACDVGDQGALRAALSSARATLPPLRGVFHAAMVLDDAPYGALDEARHLAVAHPKVRGGWNLDEATRDDPLEHFVLFSSIAGVLGTPGQANYAAANAFLDALAHTRRRAGRPGLSLDLGVLDGAGVVARASEERRRRILGQGVEAFDVARALEVLEQALHEEPIQRVAAAIDWSRLLAGVDDRETPARALSRGQADARGERSLLSELRALPPGERAPKIVAWVAEFLGQISGQDVREIDPGSSLSRLGIDSLMANQLLLWIQSRFQVEVPLVRLMQGPTLQELAEDVARRALEGRD